jgi:transcriptional regulator GlxA family with amidase domain
MHRVAILALPNARAIEITGPAEVFNEASRLLGVPLRYSVEILATDNDPISVTGGLRLLPDHTIDDAGERIDTLIAAGPSEAIAAGSSEVEFEPTVVQWLGRRFKRLRRCGAVGSGVFLLGAAGLLDGHRATAHWEHIERLTAKYPGATIERGCIFVRDGSIYTSAGATACLDLALALVEEDFGRDLALAVARRLVMFMKRPGGQDQISAHLTAQSSTKSSIQRVQQWVLDNLSADHSIASLAKRAAMSPRNFSRVFRRETKVTPAEFVKMAQMQAARQMLEDTDIPLQRLAHFCGFGNVDSMRRSFVRTLGMRPTEYRRKFESKSRSSRPTGFEPPVLRADPPSSVDRCSDEWRTLLKATSAVNQRATPISHPVHP